MPVLGEIAKQARLVIPATWDALSRDPAYGENGLQARVDSVKHELFGAVVPYEDELTLYGPLGTRYAGVVVALNMVPEGYDYWMAAATSWSAQGRNENKTFVDRAAALLRLRNEVLIPLEEALYPQVVDILPGVVVRKKGVMLSLYPDAEEHVTPDPLTFERPFEATA